MDRSEFNSLLYKMLSDHRVRDTRKGLQQNRFVKSINFHSTAQADLAKYESQLKYFSEYFTSINSDNIDEFLDTGFWTGEKPGLILAFFEGFRNQYDVILPLLQKYNLTGWFHIPAYFPDVPVAEQIQFSHDHNLDLTHLEEYPDGRIAMNWDEIRQIARDHVICCHSGTHFQIKLDTPDEVMRYEIVQARKHLQENSGHECPLFCWLYGEEYSYNPRAAVYIQEAGYRFVIGNLKMERVRIENK